MIKVKILSFHKYNPRTSYTEEYFKRATRTTGGWDDYLKQYPEPMLELGCSDGEWVEKLKGKKKEVYGLELSDYCFTIRKTKLMIKADAHILPFKDESFGSIYSFQLLEHLSAPDKCLRECKRVLVLNGYFLAKWGYGAGDDTHVSDFGNQWIGIIGKYFKHIKADWGCFVYMKVK